MTKQKGVNKNKKEDNSTPKKQCEQCKKILSIIQFYNTNSAFSSDKKLNICKKCVESMIDINNIETIYKILQLMDIPFLQYYWEIAKEKTPDNPWGNYIRMANSKINEFKNKTWKDSKFDKVEAKTGNNTQSNSTSTIEDLNVLMDKWGYGYKPEEYQAFEKKYNLLKNNYTEKTAMHTEALLNYIRYRVKEELSTASEDVDAAKKWGSLAKDAATAAKINPSQLSKADLSDGLSTFSELSQAVEKEVDIIPILPRFKYRPNDALDFNIWCYVNYIRDMKGLPPCEYEDVYTFYDRRKADYIKQYGDPYGIFTGDTTEKNRENIIKFISEEDN
jgi:hypothetical protein